MANMYPFANGNSNTTTNWYDADTGLALNRLPTLTDDVYLNGKYLYLRNDFTCNNIRATAYGSVIAGGFFYCDTGGYSITTAGSIYANNHSNTIGNRGIIQVLHSAGGNTTINCGGAIIGGTLQVPMN